MQFLDEEQGQDFYKYAASSIQGWKNYFTNTQICQAGNFQGKDSFFAVIDGHGEADCAKFTRDQFVNQIPRFREADK